MGASAAAPRRGHHGPGSPYTHGSLALSDILVIGGGWAGFGAGVAAQRRPGSRHGRCSLRVVAASAMPGIVPVDTSTPAVLPAMLPAVLPAEQAADLTPADAAGS